MWYKPVQDQVIYRRAGFFEPPAQSAWSVTSLHHQHAFMRHPPKPRGSLANVRRHNFPLELPQLSSLDP